MSLAKSLLVERPGRKVLIFALAIASALLGLTGPIYQKAFIDSLARGATSTHLASSLQDLVLFFGCFVLGIGLQLLAQFLGQKEAVHIQRALSEKIYTQMLKLKADRLQHTQVGEVVSLYTIDAAGAGAWIELAWTMGALTFFPLFMAPFMLRSLLHVPLFPLLTTMTVSVSLVFLLSWRQSKFFAQFKRLAAERTGLANEWIQNIRALRALNWVTPFEKKIFKKRVEETANRVAMVANGQSMATVGSSLGFILNLVGIFALVRARPEGAITPGELTATLWALGVFLSRYLRGIPWILTFAMDSLTSIRRVEKFLALQSDALGIDDKTALQSSSQPLLQIKNLRLRINSKDLLKDVSLTVDKPQLIAIVGSVGSGKTLFIQSLVGEAPARFDEFRVLGKNVASMSDSELKHYFSLVPQDGFTASSSIRSNILLDYDVDTEMQSTPKALRALKQVHFPLEDEGFAEGLETLIGERGVNLSGGQSQRLGLARALYADRPFLILDDSLSAVDINTERAMIESLFRGDSKDKVILFATHRHLTLPLTDRVLFFSEGRLAGDGTFDELSHNNAAFKSFILETQEKEKGPAHELLR